MLCSEREAREGACRLGRPASMSSKELRMTEAGMSASRQGGSNCWPDGVSQPKATREETHQALHQGSAHPHSSFLHAMLLRQHLQAFSPDQSGPWRRGAVAK